MGGGGRRGPWGCPGVQADARVDVVWKPGHHSHLCREDLRRSRAERAGSKEKSWRKEDRVWWGWG